MIIRAKPTPGQNQHRERNQSDLTSDVLSLQPAAALKKRFCEVPAGLVPRPAEFVLLAAVVLLLFALYEAVCGIGGFGFSGGDLS